MPFIKRPGVPGKIYVPKEQARPQKKHRCPDCRQCGMCSEDRCRLCLRRKGCCRQKPDENAE